MAYPPVTVDITKIHPDIFPWEKYPEETARAFAAFKVYRDLQPYHRKVRTACETLYGETPDGKMRQMYEWSRRFNWVFRAMEWDKEKDAEERSAHIQAIKDMRTRHTKVAQALFSNGVVRLKALSKEEILALDLSQMFAFIEKGYAMERESMGVEQVIEDVVISEQKLTIEESDFSTKTTDELRQLIAHRRHIQFPGTTPAITEKIDDTQ